MGNLLIVLYVWMIIFKNKIGRIRDIIIHPENGKIFFLNPDGLYLMEKNKN